MDKAEALALTPTPSQGMLETAWETLATSLANASSPEAIAAVLRSIWPVRSIPPHHLHR